MTADQLRLDESAENVTAECLKDLSDVEADFIKKCLLEKPRTTHAEFSHKWKLAPKDVTTIKRNALASLKNRLAEKEDLLDIGHLMKPKRLKKIKPTKYIDREKERKKAAVALRRLRSIERALRADPLMAAHSIHWLNMIQQVERMVQWSLPPAGFDSGAQLVFEGDE